MLFEECRKANPNTQFISSAAEITERLPEGVLRVGVCGATSTPKWLMEEIAERVRILNCDFHAEMADGRNCRTGEDFELTCFVMIKIINIFYLEDVIFGRITNFAANFKI